MMHVKVNVVIIVSGNGWLPAQHHAITYIVTEL